MVTLTIDNRRIHIKGASRKTIRALDEATSYMLEGFMFAPSFKAKRWDGKEHLLTYSKKRGYSAPAGLVPDVARLLKKRGVKFEVIVETKLRHKRRTLDWNPEIVLRPYQKRAVKLALSPPYAGVGILKMPIRSGKTKTAAKLIQKIGQPTLYIVPSVSLLHQSYDSLRGSLPTAEVGKIGDGEFDPQFITVATIQTLAKLRDTRPKDKRTGGKPKPDPRYKELAKSFDVVIFDECHHVRGEGTWYKVPFDIDARFKFGLSATAFPDSKQEASRGIIWMKGVCGPIRVDISTSELVREGYLMRQNVKMFRVREPIGLKNARYSATMLQKAITRNRARNNLIARITQRYDQRGGKVLIIAKRHEHIAHICEMMDDLDVNYRVVVGSDSAESRESKVDGFNEGMYNVLIGTVMGEGVDVPAIEVVINAEGGKDAKANIQRQRNLTVSNGKARAVFIDFYDDTNDYLRKHSEARLAQYRSEPEFTVEVV